MTYHINDIAPEIFDHKAMIICAGCRTNMVGEEK